MEGGYVREATISYTNPKLQIPLMASAIYAPTTTSTSPAGTPTSAATTSKNASTSASASLSPPPGPSAAAGSGGPLQGLVARLRNFRFDDAKNIRKRFHFDYISKDRFLGGQLKTKNGQKYVFNGAPSGVYVSKACLIIAAFIIVVALLFTGLITYFVTSKGFPPKEATLGCITAVDHTEVNATPIQTAGWVSLNSPPPLDTATPTSTPTATSTAQTSTTTGTTLGSPTTSGEPGVRLVDPKVGDIPAVEPPAEEVEDNTTKPTNRPLKLYEGWRPLHYGLLIEPNAETSISNGSLTIEIERDVSKVTSWEPIVLDVHNVSISNVRVIRSLPAKPGNEEQELEFDSDYGEDNATFVINLDKAYSAETQLKVQLSLDFISQVTDTLQGVYKTSYINPDTNKEEWMISTQFSPIDARRAFPCFDRPDMKANFSVSIVRSLQYKMALSNMPKSHTIRYRRGYVRDDFMVTPKMPTYLVAFIVSNMVDSRFVALDSEMSPRVEIWTRPQFIDMTNYAYKMVRKFLPYYEDFFGVKNKLPKIDLVSVPDFGFAAMENWGLITFRDSALLVPEDQELASSSEHMQYVAQIIAHELAHQWFGNLVTPKWWDDLWLKEGFACYMSYKALEHSHPEFQIMDTLTTLEFKESMEHDADNTSHAISFDVRSTNDVRRIFDPISYSKGTILLRMLNSIVGDVAFRAATRDLLKKFAYGNMDRDELWAILTHHGHEQGTLPKDLSVKQIMDSWITQPGYPVVNVERRGADLILSQQRYLLPSKNPGDQSSWFIPITFETDELRKGDNVPSHWMRSQDEGELIVGNVFTHNSNSDNVIYLNLNRQGYYRVNYDMTSWLALKKNFSTLPRITRAQLLDDALHLSQAEYLSYDIPLTFLMELFTSVDDELLWSAAKPGLNYLIYNLKREPAFETFRAFMKFIVRPAFDHYGLNEPDNESHLQLKHRALVAYFACKFNYDRCTQVAQVKFREWMRDAKKNPIKPNLKSVIYCTALAEGSSPEWYFAYKQYKTTTSASEKEEILTSLGCTTKPWLLSKYLNMTINPTSGILKQDGALAFRAVASNAIGHEIAFDFLQGNIKEIAEYYGDGFSTLSEMIKSLTIYMNKDYHKHQLLDLAATCRKLGLKAVESAIDLALEQVNNNIYWRSHSYHSLKNFLEGIVSEFQINIF
ncbi:aminopeptidase N isoform X2 [Drosophila biarmipes]|uniref:aminopeptidase N isoform X2 n=1 Tax=Drosophila biarmipes TaxID=125945 RepID=UPI0007E74D83|nr:aminopeptidase N isoform X2 [Drosophila biarmipes]